MEPMTNGFHRFTVVESLPLRQTNGLRRIAVAGAGYVGLVTGACLAELGNSVVCLDNDPQKIAMLRRGELPLFEPGLLEAIVENDRAGRLAFSDDVEAGIRESNVVFIAVGTPTQLDGNIDLSGVRDVAVKIGNTLDEHKTVIVKSTVPVGSCEMVEAIIAENSSKRHRVDVVSNPEFLREGSAVADFMHPDRIVIGTENPHAESVVRSLYAPLDAPVFVTDVRTSEMIKYAANAFLAMKISFMNEIANICELVDVDVQAVGRGIGFDHRIGTQHMNPGIGYGGSCFPKDVRALERAAHARGYDAALLRSVEAVNRAQVGRTFAKIEGALGGSLLGKTICVLGLAFKPNTSDVRESPALRLIELFLKAGATVTAHDPVAVETARTKLDGNVSYFTDMYEAMRGCDALLLATEWSDYSGIDFGVVRQIMRGNVVFDGRHFFDAEDVVTEGLWYIGVGRAREPARIAYLEALGE